MKAIQGLFNVKKMKAFIEPQANNHSEIMREAKKSYE